MIGYATFNHNFTSDEVRTRLSKKIKASVSNEHELRAIFASSRLKGGDNTNIDNAVAETFFLYRPMNQVYVQLVYGSDTIEVYVEDLDKNLYSCQRLARLTTQAAARITQAIAPNLRRLPLTECTLLEDNGRRTNVHWVPVNDFKQSGTLLKTSVWPAVVVAGVIFFVGPQILLWIDPKISVAIASQAPLWPVPVLTAVGLVAATITGAFGGVMVGVAQWLRKLPRARWSWQR